MINRRRVAAVLALALPAGLASATEPAPSADLVRAKNAEIVARSPGSSGVFDVLGTGEVRHLQSGVRCPAGYPNLRFWHAEVFSSAVDLGGDVGCDYGRAGADGKWVSKLTVFMVKAKGVSLDQAFASYKAELEAKHPAARFIGPAITVVGEKGGPVEIPKVGAFRSAEYEEVIDGVRHLSDLVVGLKNGWVIEVRATFRTDHLCSGPGPCTAEAASAAADLATPSVLFITAAETLTRPAGQVV